MSVARFLLEFQPRALKIQAASVIGACGFVAVGAAAASAVHRMSYVYQRDINEVTPGMSADCPVVSQSILHN